MNSLRNRTNFYQYVLKNTMVVLMLCWLTGPVASAPMTGMPAKAVLSLREAVLLAVRNNPNIISAELDTALARYDLALVKNRNALHYGITGNVDYQRMNIEGQTQSSSYYQLTPQVDWLSPYGTNITLGIANSWTDSRPYLQGTVEIKQPLLAGFSTTLFQQPLVFAENDLYAKTLQENQAIIDTVTKTVLLYRQIILDEQNQIVQEKSLEEIDRNIWVTQEKIKRGQVEETATLQLRLQKQTIELSLERAKNQMADHLRILKLVLGWGATENVTIDSQIDFKREVLPNKAAAFEQALEHDIAYQVAKRAVQQGEAEMVIARNAQLPDLDLIARGAVGKSPSLDNEQAFTPIIDINNNNADIRLQASVPIDDMNRKRKLFVSLQQLQRARMQLQNCRDNVLNAVETIYATLESQSRQLSLAQSELVLAHQSYELELKKLQLGRSSSLNVTLMQNSDIRAKINLIQNELDYQNTLTQFDALVGHTLQTWGIMTSEVSVLNGHRYRYERKLR